MELLSSLQATQSLPEGVSRLLVAGQPRGSHHNGFAVAVQGCFGRSAAMRKQQRTQDAFASQCGTSF